MAARASKTGKMVSVGSTVKSIAIADPPADSAMSSQENGSGNFFAFHETGEGELRCLIMILPKLFTRARRASRLRALDPARRSSTNRVKSLTLPTIAGAETSCVG